MKKILAYMLLIVMIAGSFSIPVSAEESIDVYVNGKLLEVDQPAIAVNGRTLVPLRAICEALRCEVIWDNATKSIQIQNEVTIIAMQIDNYWMSKVDREDETNVQTVQLDVPPIIYDRSTMVPTRAIAEALHALVEWNGSRKCVEITMEYDTIGLFEEGMAEVTKDNKHGFINEKREVVVPLIYDDAWSFSEGFATVTKDGKYGHVNTNGEEIVPLIYDEAWSFSEGLAEVKKDGMWGYVNTEGKVAVPPIYEFASVFKDGLAQVSKDGKYGFVNKRGELVVQLIYDYAGDFSEGLAFVKKNEKWGYINTDGKVAIPLIYDYARYFYNGRAKVEKNGELFDIDKDGNRIPD